MCTLNDFTEKVKGKVIKKATLESDCGGEFIHIIFEDDTTMNIQDTSEGTENLQIFINDCEEETYIADPEFVYLDKQIAKKVGK